MKARSRQGGERLGNKSLYGQCLAKSPFWKVFSSFQILGFSINSKEFLSNGSYTHPKLDYPILKLLGTEFIISHIF